MQAAGASIGTGKSRLSPTGPGHSFPCSRVRSTPCTQSQWSNPSAAQMLKQTSFHLINKSQALLDPLLPRIWDGLPKHDRLPSTPLTPLTPAVFLTSSPCTREEACHNTIATKSALHDEHPSLQPVLIFSPTTSSSPAPSDRYQAQLTNPFASPGDSHTMLPVP